MNNELIKEHASALFSSAGFIAHIVTDADYQSALELMDDLIEDYELHRSLIVVLSESIERWEDTADEFTQFNATFDGYDEGLSTLRAIIDQHQLKAVDLKEVIGCPSLVSMILNGSRKLTTRHIQALSTKFNLTPSLFFS